MKHPLARIFSPIAMVILAAAVSVSLELNDSTSQSPAADSVETLAFAAGNIE